jgi:hypothetical protein
MRGPFVRITALILCGLAVAVGVGWGAGSPPQVGEAVPDAVAATERGGDCPFWACAQIGLNPCFNTNQTNNGHVCLAAVIFAVDGTTPARRSECSTYCGANDSGTGPCTEYPTTPTARCATSP